MNRVLLVTSELLKSLKLLPNQENRPIKKSNVKKLVSSLSVGKDITVVIRVADLSHIDGYGNGYYVIDGQHRLHAVIEKGYDLSNVIVVVDVIRDKEHLKDTLAILNNSVKKWSPLDYLNLHQELAPYRLMKKFWNKPFSSTAIAMCIEYNMPQDKAMKAFQAGELGSDLRSDMEQILTFTADVWASLPFPEKKHDLCQIFIKEYVKNKALYRHKGFIKYLQSSNDGIRNTVNAIVGEGKHETTNNEFRRILSEYFSMVAEASGNQ